RQSASPARSTSATRSAHAGQQGCPPTPHPRPPRPPMSFFDSQRREARNRALWRAAYLAPISALLLGIGAVSAIVSRLFEAPSTALQLTMWIGVAACAIVVVVSTLTYPIAHQPAALPALPLGASPLDADSDGERQRLRNVCAEMAISA